MLYESVLISGFGGQGILFAGRALAQAALDAGLFTTFFPSYGAEIRGGTANCTVIISDMEIGSPVVLKWKNLIMLNKPSYLKFKDSADLSPQYIINSSLVGEDCGCNCHKLPFSGLSKEKLNDIRYANVISLGAFITIKKIFDAKFLQAAVKKILGEQKKELVENNIKALEIGAIAAGGEVKCQN